jgi:serine/threonine protein kinase
MFELDRHGSPLITPQYVASRMLSHGSRDAQRVAISRRGRADATTLCHVPPQPESISEKDLYRLSARTLGVGTYSRVFRAENRATGEVVALKRAKETNNARARIKREIEAQSILAPHPHIMPVYDHDPGHRWYTMPVAENTLFELRDQLDEDDLVSILQDLSRGLEVAHEQNMVHRDISPKNILALPGTATGGRRWVVADWGMVSRQYGPGSPRLTGTGVGMGTPGFDAPELDIDPSSAPPATDVYSLGRVAAWFVTRRWPNSGHPLTPSGPVLRWRLFVKKCTEPDLADRIANMADLRAALDRVFTDYEGPPAERTRQMLEAILSGDLTQIGELVSTALAHPENAEIHLDHVARMTTTQITEWSRQNPSAAAQVACQVARHLVSDPWDRDQEYAATPLGFIFSVLKELVELPRLAEAVDVAELFFTADAHWKLSVQRQRSVDWLNELKSPGDTAMARILAGRTAVLAYYRSSISPASPYIGAVFES